MTNPLPVAPDPEQLAIELAAATAVTRDLRSKLQEAVRQIMGAYIVYAGTLDNPIPDRFRAAFTGAVQRIIGQVNVDVRQQLWEMVWRALIAGQRTAISYLTGAPQDLIWYGSAAYHEAVAGAVSAAQAYGEPAVGTAQWAGDVVYSAQARLEASLLGARGARFQMPPQIQRFTDVLAALAPLNRSVVDLERDTRWAINASFNQASRDIADRHELGRMWVAERDACLHCLALSGQIAPAGQPYDGSLTYYVGVGGALKPLPVWPPGAALWGPPRHPNCRCHQIPVPVLSGYPVMPWETQAYHPAQALQREARRAVLRGASGTDSMPARLRATSALLAAGAHLPRSVEARARAAVRAGQYRR